MENLDRPSYMLYISLVIAKITTRPVPDPPVQVWVPKALRHGMHLSLLSPTSLDNPKLTT